MVGKVEGARGKIRGRKTTFVVGLGHIGGLALGVMERGGEGRGGDDFCGWTKVWGNCAPCCLRGGFASCAFIL